MIFQNPVNGNKIHFGSFQHQYCDTSKMMGKHFPFVVLNKH